MLRLLQPTDIIRLTVDSSASGFTVPIQVNGPCSIIALAGAGSVTVQVNNGNMYNVRMDYPVRASWNCYHTPTPQLNSSFSSMWANTTLTGRATSSNVFINRDIEARYIRLSGRSMSSTTRSTVFAHVYARPRV